MKNSKLRRILLTLACAVLLVSLSVGATLAYLTSKTEVVKNTFTVGNVKITLDEKNTDGKDKAGNANPDVARDDGNKYHLLPAGKYEKDPTVHVDAESEDCYVRMIVTVGNYAQLAKAFPKATYGDYWNGDNFNLHMVVDGWEDDTWLFKSAANGVYEFWYNGIATKGQNLPALFTHIVLPGELTNAQIAELSQINIDVIAHAIQSDSFVDAAAAWAAWVE